MKKLVATLIATGMLLGFGAAFAQDQKLEDLDSHELQITIPPVILLRFVTSAGVRVAADPVVFDILPGTFNPLGTYTAPAANWSDIEVFFNDGDFTVEVETNNASFDWSKVTVTPAGSLVAEFDLPENTNLEILGQTSSSGNWQSLGISPASYSLTLTGEEEPGTYTTTVTYTVYEF
jgi:hypothetical protein